MALKKGFRQLVEMAEAEVETISVADAKKLVEDEDTVIVDLRDIRELWNSGTIPGSVHAPRGMLEFWVDPDSPYHRDVFSSGKKLVFFCAAGWRSALATKAVQDMGVSPVAHIGGGFSAWTGANGPVEEKEKK